MRDFRPSDNPDFRVNITTDDRGFVKTTLNDNDLPVFIGAGGSPPLYTATTHGRSYFNDWWKNRTFEGQPRYKKVETEFSYNSSTTTISWTSEGYWPIVSSSVSMLHSLGNLTQGTAYMGDRRQTC